RPRSRRSSQTGRYGKRPKPSSRWRASARGAGATTARWSWSDWRARTVRRGRRRSARARRLGDATQGRILLQANAGLPGVARDGLVLAQCTPGLQGDPVELGFHHPALGVDATLAITGEEAAVAPGERRRPARLPLGATLRDALERLARLVAGIGAPRRMAGHQDRRIGRARAAGQA